MKRHAKRDGDGYVTCAEVITIAIEKLGDKTLKVRVPLDDESLQVHDALDDIAATADWLEDKDEKGVAEQLQTPREEGPKQIKPLYVLESLDDIAAAWLRDNEEKGVVYQLQTPEAEDPKRNDGREVSAQHRMVPTSLEMLSQPDIWICNMGASSHSTNGRSGTKNERNTESASLGHTGQALNATMTIDIPGQYVTKDGKWDIQATLTEVTFNRKRASLL